MQMHQIGLGLQSSYRSCFLHSSYKKQLHVLGTTLRKPHARGEDVMVLHLVSPVS